MKFNDIIKNSILEGFNTDITTTKIFVTLMFTIILGIYVYFVYRNKTKSEFYSKDFNAVLAGLPLITAAIVLAMQSNIVISLGMVGALSIVRFRNAVKSSLDLLFLFWSISIGIICGAGLYEISVILCLTITILLFILDMIPNKKKSMLLVVNFSNIKTETDILNILKKYCKNYTVKSRSVSNKNIDIIIEIRTKNEEELINDILKIKDVSNFNLLLHDGESRV